MPRKTIPPLVRFLRQIEILADDRCWEWHKTKTLRPTFYVGTKQVSVYRFSYEHFVGPIGKGLLVCHKCDNPRCVNPSHLFLGTYKDNTQDAVRKGRLSHGSKHTGFQLKGESVYCAVLSEDDVRFIRENYIPRHPEFGIRAMARKFGITHAAVGFARRGKNWKSVAHFRPSNSKE